MSVRKDAYLYWIHCNRCFEIYMRKRRRFFLLACQHVGCEKCAQPEVTAGGGISCNCPICKKSVRVCQLGNTMSSHLKQLFHPHPWEEDSESTIRFQNRQREHFQRGMAQMCAKNIEQKATLEQHRDRVQVLYAEHQKLRRQVHRTHVIIAERQQKKQELRNRIEAQRSAPSTTDDSIVNSAPRQRYIPGYGRGTSTSIYNFGSTSRPRSLREVTGFAHPPRNKSFIL